MLSIIAQLLVYRNCFGLVCEYKTIISRIRELNSSDLHSHYNVKIYLSTTTAVRLSSTIWNDFKKSNHRDCQSIDRLQSNRGYFHI